MKYNQSTGDLRELCEEAARILPADFTDGPGLRKEDRCALAMCDDLLEQALRSLNQDEEPIKKVLDLLLAMREHLESIEREEWSRSEFASWFEQWRITIGEQLDMGAA